ncbi:hypothetical protein ACFO5R_07115 [Halosolutus amylolyticus]|uniref:ACT domain-containing protein n=1 Tax=Halosolutus amylolyticus TaxID=2932267 RepID=A0ABD5PP79_9EURY|nr:hypothetical protein [Halosolutus amylolyticus]
MSLAAETRRAVDRRPFLAAALRAGVVNYTAAARYLDVDGDPEAIATALRRYAEELPTYETTGRDVRVRMRSGIGVIGGESDVEDDDTAGDRGLLTVGGVTVGACDGGKTAIVATGGVDAAALAHALQTLSIDDVDPDAAAVGEGTMVIVVDRREGATALRTIEAALDRVPDR